MERHRVAIRILGVASTTHGFAFCVTEDPARLLDWGRTNMVEERDVRAEIARLLDTSRPLFVTCEVARNGGKSARGRTFNRALKGVCKEAGIMILCIERRTVETDGRGKRPVTNYEIAEAAARSFPLLANKLPKKRRIWDGSDDRIGVLLAAAAAAAGWAHFRSPR